MARKKSKSSFRRFVRSAGRKVSKGYRKGSKLMSNLPIRPYSIGYGFIRTKLATALDPLTSKIPAGEFADEVGIGLIAWFVGKKVPALKPFAETALEVENYRVGELLANKTGNNTKQSSSEW